MEKNEQILEYFHILKKQNTLGTSYLFIGQDTSAVRDIIKLINCEQTKGFCDSCWDCQQIQKGTHPDLFLAAPQGLTTRIETVREAIRFFSLKSFRAKYKAMVIEDGTSLSPAAANAFLKTLEEPPRNSFIAICASKLDGILPTIISRCRKIFLAFEHQGPDADNFKLASSFLEGEDVIFKNRQKFSEFLKALIMLLHNNILARANYRNNQLSETGEYEIILRRCGLGQMQAILEDALEVYGAYKTVNMNLALNLIRMKL